ncbi:hypothetical protein AAMO2058_001127800 [Amorphochlora amoebiformis]
MFSKPLKTEAWQCKATSNSASVAAVAVCGSYETPKEKSRSPEGELIADAAFSSLKLYISHANEQNEGTVRMLKPIITTPGDSDPIATATVDWPVSRSDKPVSGINVPFARTMLVPDLFDEDEEVYPEVDNAYELSVSFKCMDEGISPMLLVFLFTSENHKGYERVTVALHKNCTGPDVISPQLDTDESADLDLETLESGGIGETAVTDSSSPSEYVLGSKTKRGGIHDVKVGISIGGEEVIKKGKVRRKWDQAARFPMTSEASESAKLFYISLHEDAETSAIRMTTASVYTSNSTVVKATVDVQTHSGFQQIDRHPSILTVNMECISSGRAAIGVAIPTSVGILRFQFRKICEEEKGSTRQQAMSRRKRQGLALMGFSVGTKAGDVDVVRNGLVQTAYELPETDTRIDSESSSRAPPLPARQKNTTFFLGLNHKFFPLKYSRPTVVADSDLNSPIAFPTLYGSYMENTKLKDKDIHSLTVTFNCVRSGIGEFIIALPLGRLGTIRFAFRKKCTDDRNSRHEEAQLQINGLNIGSLNLDDVVSNGEPTREYKWSADSVFNQMAEVGPETSVSRFIISRDVAPDSKEVVLFDEPTITPHRTNVIDPEIGRGTLPPFVIDGKTPAAKVRVVYHCKRRAATLVTIALPWTLTRTVYQGGTAIPERFMGTIHIHLIKRCNDPHREVTRDEGGVDIPGFNIGYKAFSSNVVRDGFPTRHYFGQRNRVNPDWKAIMVGPEVAHTTFHVSYKPLLHQRGTDRRSIDFWKSMEEEQSATVAVMFDPPMIHSHDAIARPELVGKAANGAHLFTGATASLTIRWNCRFNGTAVASVRIPVRPSGFITFTVPKICKKKRTLAAALKREEDLASGVYISTEYDDSNGQKVAPDVVDDGVTLLEFSTYRSGKRGGRFAVDPFEHSTMFFVWHEKLPAAPSRRGLFGGTSGEGGVQVLEPMIFTHRPICNPSLQHNFEVDRAGGIYSQQGMMLLLNEMVHMMNVTYNCVWEGETAITVVIPLSNGGKVSFTWTKVCSESEYDQFIPHCVQYKTPEQSETILGAMWEYVTSFTVSPEQETVHLECDECEDGYVVVKADDWQDYDMDGRPLPPPTVKKDTCVRNTSHFGYEDEAFDNLDTHHLEDDLAGNMPRVGEVDHNEGWHEHDEINWKKDSISAAHAAVEANLDPSSGMLNVGTTPTASDVVLANTAGSKYALQGSIPATIPSSVSKSVFYLSLPEGVQTRQQIGYATVKTRLVEGEKACEATIGGEASRGGEISPGTSAKLEVEYKCERPGATAVLIVVPLHPGSSSLSFRVVKLCKGYRTYADRAWIAHKSVLVSSFMLLLVLFCCCGDKCNGKRSRLSGPGSITLVSLDSSDHKVD